MTLRLDTTLATATSAAFTPTGDIVLTYEGANPLAIPTIAVQTRNDPADVWQNIILWHPTFTPVLKLSTAKEVQLVLTKNIAGSQVRVWDNV